ncbi:hypothetical protein [Rhodococcus opacus]|uniref:Uncharacterized protein n=2 Tax=Rhodococcus TaxID=1827 RepID=C1BDY6_RHOOB|nr:hypothetical protein [Rhodococcus opacus]BAH47189.1 hypothetical protein ROP_pROB02-01820 [Rhodococcus opacus B4]
MSGGELAARVYELAAAPDPRNESTPAVIARHADALETYLRLTLSEYGSKNRLFILFEDIKQPQPRRYAQAMVRAIATAFDHWELDDNLVESIQVLTGARAPRPGAVHDDHTTQTAHQQTIDIALDAAWATATIELARVLRASSARDTLMHIGRARTALAPITGNEDAIDAIVLDSTLKILSDFLTGVTESSTGEWPIEPSAVAELEHLVTRYRIGAHGLHHWVGDRKQSVLTGWGRLAQDLLFLRTHLERASIYRAAVVLDDILDIYTASRAVEVVARESDLDGVRRMLQPPIVGSFAARAGLLRNLEDHVDELQKCVDNPQSNSHGRAGEVLPVARIVLEAARDQVAKHEPPGKTVGASAPLPPPLADLFGGGNVPNAIAELDPEILKTLAIGITDARDSRGPFQHVAISAVCERIKDNLSASPDYKGDIKDKVDYVLELLVRFLHSRINIEKKYKPYLYKPNASENDLHLDLFDYLVGSGLAGFAQIELTNVAGGRADIQVGFGAFHIYLELKADATKARQAAKTAYIQQTVSYQGGDIRIGFLIILRLGDGKGAPPHLSDLVTHTTTTIAGSAHPRHVVIVELPGNRTVPSNMK